MWSSGGLLLLPEKLLKTSQNGFKEVLRTSSGRRLGDVLEKGRRDFHFRPIYDVFETKIKTFLRRLWDVIVSAGY